MQRDPTLKIRLFSMTKVGSTTIQEHRQFLHRLNLATQKKKKQRWKYGSINIWMKERAPYIEHGADTSTFCSGEVSYVAKGKIKALSELCDTLRVRGKVETPWFPKREIEVEVLSGRMYRSKPYNLVKLCETFDEHFSKVKEDEWGVKNTLISIYYRSLALEDQVEIIGSYRKVALNSFSVCVHGPKEEVYNTLWTMERNHSPRSEVAWHDLLIHVPRSEDL